MNARPLKKPGAVSLILNELGALTCLATTTGFLGNFWWVFDLASHFRVQYAVILAFTALYSLFLKRFKWSFIFFIFLLFNVLTIAPFYFKSRTPSSSGSPRLKLLLINVQTENLRVDLVRGLVEETKPDLLLLEEVNERWMTQLNQLEQDFPHKLIESREDNFGIALFSRLPLEEPKIVHFSIGLEKIPSVFSRIRLGDGHITFVGTHPFPPSGNRGASYRNDQLNALAPLLKASTEPTILLGDLNLTPWSAQYRRLIRQTGLKDTSKGFGIQPTWPSFFSPIRIPIDHCLVSPEFKTVDRKTGPDVGSDHFPLLIELEIPAVSGGTNFPQPIP